MDCREIRKRLSPYLDRELNEGESKNVADHIRSCPDCALELKALHDTYSLLREDTEVEPSQDFLARLSERLYREEERYPSFRRAYWSLSSLPVFARLAIVLIVGALIGIGLGSLTSLERNALVELKQGRNVAVEAGLNDFQNVHPQSLTQAYINVTSPFKS